MFHKFTDDYLTALGHADGTAMSFGSDVLEPFHLLIGVLCIPDCYATEILESNGVTLDWVNKIMLDVIDVKEVDYGLETDELPLSGSARKVLERANLLADDMNVSVDANHIALSLLHCDPVTRTLVSKVCPPDDLYHLLSVTVLEEAERTVKPVIVNQVTIE